MISFLFGQWSVVNVLVVAVLHFYWSGVSFYFREWSMVHVLISIWSGISGSWSVVCSWSVVLYYTKKDLYISPVAEMSKIYESYRIKNRINCTHSRGSSRSYTK